MSEQDSEQDAEPARRTRAESRGRVVMLVDNVVRGDSRVQKQARSMADAGWDVVLIGRSPDRQKRRWRLGQARVIQLPVATPLARRRHEFRRAPLRAPLAYPAGPLADYRLQKMRARIAELDARRARLGGGRRGAVVGVQRKVARAQQRWVELRAAQSRSLHAARRAMTNPLDRLTTAFWTRVLGTRSWRRLDPGLWDWEIAYGPEIDRLKPDIVHANDFRMLGVGARAVQRRRARGRRVSLVWDAHEYLPGIKPWNDHPRWHAAQIAHEAEHAPYADAVVTVSPSMGARLVRQHGLAEPPKVVMNAPSTEAAERSEVVGLRDRIGLAPDVPLMVYSGIAAVQRGLDVMVELLGRMPEVHVALVVPKHDAPYVRGLVARARELGAEDRLHLLDYVPVDDIVPFLAQADVGVIPIHHWPNHEVTLTTKFFEYAQARLPLVVSDVEATADLVRETGQGEVFVADDVDDYVRASRAVLADLARYRAAYDVPGRLEEWTWEAQARVLDDVYTAVLPGGSAT